MDEVRLCASQSVAPIELCKSFTGCYLENSLPEKDDLLYCSEAAPVRRVSAARLRTHSDCSQMTDLGKEPQCENAELRD